MEFALSVLLFECWVIVQGNGPIFPITPYQPRTRPKVSHVAIQNDVKKPNVTSQCLQLNLPPFQRPYLCCPTAPILMKLGMKVVFYILIAHPIFFSDEICGERELSTVEG